MICKISCNSLLCQETGIKVQISNGISAPFVFIIPDIFNAPKGNSRIWRGEIRLRLCDLSFS